MAGEVDIDVLYAILRERAKAQKPLTYGELSAAYERRTGTFIDPHRGWDYFLGEVNNRAAAIDAPAISALVVVGDTGEPGPGFWGCAENVPKRPASELVRTRKWLQILAEVKAYAWPERTP